MAQLDNLDPISDDMSIARGLLGRPQIPPRRRTSFTSTTTGGGQLEVSNEEVTITETRNEGRRRMIQSSNTWTASSGEAFSELDDVEDRAVFVTEYNRLALKHGVRTLYPEDPDFGLVDSGSGSNKSGSWFTRKIFRKTSSSQSVKIKGDRLTKHRRSISDLSLRLKPKSDALKDKDLQDLVRLCGLSLLYLPTEYAATSLAVPTCFRATAQYLVQHASTSRGVFRIPGSHNVVAALYNHYCTMDNHGEVVAGTVRCPTLPDHIRCDVHDVASAFKKFISGLPGGVLGSLRLFDALISIQTQLNSAPELTRTKQSKIRARLIALAIATLRSQYRRELICAVFGLLSMIGRTAEIAPRENDHGRPLPTSDLMGYGPLGIVFGPLLIGDLLENYTMRLANPRGGLVLLPISPPKSRKERSKKSKASEDTSHFNSHVDKVKIANNITEMLITHWRDVVRHMKNLKALKVVRSYKSLETAGPKQPFLRPSASESFALYKPPDWSNNNSPLREGDACESPTPASRGVTVEGRFGAHSSTKSTDTLNVRKERLRARPKSSQMLSGARSLSILSPTEEENAGDCIPEFDHHAGQAHISPSSPPRSPNTPLMTSTSGVKVSGSFTLPPRISGTSTNPAPPLAPTQMYSVVENPWAGTIEPSNGHQNGQRAGPEGLSEVKRHDSPTREEVPNTSTSVTKPKHSLTQIRLLGPRILDVRNEHKALSAITVSQRAPSIQPKDAKASAALRRVSASEPGSRSENPHRCPPRSSKSTFGDSAYKAAGQDWQTSKDPLARVTIAEDLAFLVTLAHVLEEEPVQSRVASDTNCTPNISHQGRFSPSSHVYKKAEIDENTQNLSEERHITLRQLTIEGQAEKPQPRYELKPVSDRTSGTAHIDKPKAIEGPNYSHLSGRTPSPKKKGNPDPFTKKDASKSPKQQSPLISPRTSATGNHIEGHVETAFDQSPRLSVKDLAAKFSTGNSRSLSSPSPRKSLSHSDPVDARAISDSSPKEKIVAHYTTNTPSPAKSQKSAKSDGSHKSCRLAPPLERNFAKPSPPRRLLRFNLNDTTPLRSVRASLEETPISAMGALVSPVAELPICCAPPSSPQQVSRYDGTPLERSRRASSDPFYHPEYPHVHIEPHTADATSDKMVATSRITETTPMPMAINHFANAPPTRSNSLLHAQIQDLQLQLKTKTEELRHLKQQSARRGSLDIGALSEELRELKKELHMWKARAEIAEKQLEVMASLSTRSLRHSTENSASAKVDASTSSQPKKTQRENAATVSARSRRGIHGMDGASSILQLASSEESSATVVRDGRDECAAEGEYSMWEEQK